jgi:hypothetical protein
MNGGEERLLELLGTDEGLLHYLLRVGLGLPPRDRRRTISNSRAGPTVSPNRTHEAQQLTQIW